jgi:hypothetical protein
LTAEIDMATSEVREAALARDEGPVLAEAVAQLREALARLRRAREAAGREPPHARRRA